MEFPSVVVRAINEWKFHKTYEIDESQLFVPRKIVEFRLRQLGMNKQAIDYFLSRVAEPNLPNYYLVTAETPLTDSQLRRNTIGNCLFLLKTLTTQHDIEGRELVKDIYVCIES